MKRIISHDKHYTLESLVNGVLDGRLASFSFKNILNDLPFPPVILLGDMKKGKILSGGTFIGALAILIKGDFVLSKSDAVSSEDLKDCFDKVFADFPEKIKNTAMNTGIYTKVYSGDIPYQEVFEKVFLPYWYVSRENFV